MSTGCDQGIGLSDSFAKLSNELALWAKIQRFPLNATFELTPLCNLRCPMCYVRLDRPCMLQKGKLMTAAEWLEIARQSVEMGMLNVILTGGEPFLHPEFWTIYEGLKEMGLLVTIYTNGCLIDEEIVERLKANPPYNMKISVYGATDGVYETMCGDPHGFTRVSRGLTLLKEAGVPFYCTTTVVHENVRDMPALGRFMVENQIRFIPTLGVTLAGRGGQSDPASSRLNPWEQRWTQEGLEKEKHRPFTRPFAACGGYETFYFMTWQGHLTYCAYAPKPYVAVRFPLRLKECWDQLLELTGALRIPVECASCEHAEFCNYCPGLLAAESGDPEQVCESFCRTAAAKHRAYEAFLTKETENQGASLL